MKKRWDTKEFRKLRKNVGLALKAMSKKVVLDHRKENLPLIVWEDGKVVEKDPFSVKI